MCNLFIVALVGLIICIIGLVLTDKNIIDLCYISIAGAIFAFIFSFAGFFQILEYNCFYADNYEPARITIAENYKTVENLTEINDNLIRFKSIKTAWGNWSPIPDSVFKLELLKNNK